MKISRHLFMTISALLFSATHTLGFLFDTPTETPTTTATTTTSPTTTTPQCVWYGQCGHGWNNGKLNCPATDVTKHPPLLTDPKGLGLLNTLCPDFYVDDTHTRTCCDTLQLQTISDSVGIVQQVLSRCPACLKNFMNEICYTVCSVNQSQFMWANFSAPKPPAYTTGIPSVTYIFTEQYAQSLFDSCKDVQIPTMHEKALSLLCGISAKNCTPHVWLDYMGSISNGQAPFPINYIFSNTTWISPDNRTLTPLDVDNLDCDDPKFGCSPTDCGHTIPVPVAPPPTEKTRQEYFTKLFGSGYDAIEVKISRKDNATKIKHDFAPPSSNSIMFTAMYDRQFMHQVLTLQLQVAEVQAGDASGPISLSDVCTVQQGDCVTESTLQYWENNATAVDLVIHDKYGFFVLADYLDHYLSCVRNPNSTEDGTRLNMTCLSTFDGATLPWIVLEGYDGSNYQNATAFVITYILKNDPNTSAWQAAAMNFLASYNNPNMTITSRRINNPAMTAAEVKPDKPLVFVADSKSGVFDEVVAPHDISEANPGYEVVQDDIIEDGDDDGHCVWYGRCGKGWNNGNLDCLATNKTRNAPLLTDPKALEIVKKFCPQYYNGHN